MRKALKRSFIEDAKQECGGDSAELWKVIKRFWPNKLKKTVISHMSNSEIASEIPDILNDHFCNIGPKLAETIDGSRVFMRQHNVDSEHFGFEYVTE